MSEDFYKRLANVESSGDVTAKNPRSSATGLYQMTQDTFKGLQDKVPWLQHSTWEQHAQDPKIQRRAAEALTQQNEAIMKQRGHEANDLNRYLYHFAGAGGANKLLSADPNTAVKDLLGKKVVKANPFLRNMTVADLQNHFGKKLGVKSAPQVEPSPSPLAGTQALAPWLLYGRPAKAYAEGGAVNPWDLYKSPKDGSQDNVSNSGSRVDASPSESNPQAVSRGTDKKPRGVFDQLFKRGTPASMVSAPHSGTGAGIADLDSADPYNPLAYIGEDKKTEQGRLGKAIGRGVKKTLQVGGGLAQGAVMDPAIAIAQMLPGETADQFAKAGAESYDKFRKGMGGEGFDFARLGGNVVSPAAIKGAQLVNKGFGMWGKSPGLVKQGATLGGVAAGLNPVLPEAGEEDPSFWGEKAKQVGSGMVLGGALNKLIGKSASAAQYQNPGNLPATPAQLANQGKTALDDVSQYRKMFPDAHLTWGQQLGGRAHEVEQRLQSMPFIGNVLKNAREKALQSQNVSMMNKALEPAGVKVTKGVPAGRGMFDDAYTQLSRKYDDVLDQASLHNPADLRNKIMGTLDNGNYKPGVVSDDYAMLSEAGKKKFDNLIEKGLFEKFGKDPAGQHSVRMTGRKFKEYEEGLKNTIDDYMHGVGEDRTIGRMLKNSLGEAYQNLQGATPDVTKKLKDINKAYAQFKTLETASTASAQSGGVFNPLQTIKAATKGSRSQVARGKGLLQPEAELSQRVLGTTVPDSGTAGRLMTANPFSNLVGGALSLPLELLYSPKLTTLATQTGRKLGEKVEGTRVGRALGNQADKITSGTVRYQSSPNRSKEDDDEDYRRGGRIQNPDGYDEVVRGFARGGLAEGGEVQWSDIQGAQQALQDPREVAYGQPLEDTTFVGTASKIFRPNLARYAEKMEKAGKTPEEIWSKTMTARLPETKQWVQEIADTPDMFKMHGIYDNQYRHLDKGVKADKLFEAYPELAQQFYRNNPKMRGFASHSYTPNIGDRAAEKHMFDMNLPSMNKAGKDPHSSLLHEIQHYIQSREGWPQGGSQETGAMMAMKAGKAKPLVSPEDQKALAFQVERLKGLQSQIAGMKRFKGQAAQMRHLEGKIIDTEKFLSDNVGKLGVDQNVAHEYYKRLGGEAQSRLTENRRGLTAKERKQYYPFEARSEKNPFAYDLDPKDLITKGYGENYAEGGEVEPSLVDSLKAIGSGLRNRDQWQAAGAGAKRVAQAVPSVAESLGRGALATIPGTLGDVSDLVRLGAPETMQKVFGERKLPTTEEILQKLPRMTKATRGADNIEMMGGLLSPAAMAAKAPLNSAHYLATRGLRKPVFGTETAVTNPSILRNVSLDDPLAMARSENRLRTAMPNEQLLHKDWGRSQGAWQGSQGFEANPLFTTELPRHMGAVKNQPYMKDLAQLSDNLMQDANAVTRFTPQLFKDPKKANAAMLRNVTPEQIRQMGKMGLTNDMVLASRPNNRALVMGFDDAPGKIEDLVKQVQKHSPKAKAKYGTSKQDTDRVYMTKNDEGWAPTYQSFGAKPGRSKRLEELDQMLKGN